MKIDIFIRRFESRTRRNGSRTKTIKDSYYNRTAVEEIEDQMSAIQEERKRNKNSTVKKNFLFLIGLIEM